MGRYFLLLEAVKVQCYIGFLFASVSWLLAIEPYVPGRPVIVDELWRWSEIEPLIPYTVRDAAEAPDGTIWFGVLGGLVEYNGLTATPHWLADHGIEVRAVTNVLSASDGAIYALIKKRILRFRNGNWESLYEVDNVGFGNNRVAEASDGSIWFGLREGLFRSVNGRVQKVACDFERISKLLVDKSDRLWISSEEEASALAY